MNYGYIYKITYKDKRSHLFNHFYYGKHKLWKNESLLDSNGPHYYHGSSSRANKEYWPYYTEHTKEIICWAADLDELNKLEVYYISININDPLCINCAPGGYGGTLFISDETKKKISDANKGKIISEEQRKRHSEMLKGKHPWNYGKSGAQTAWNKGLIGVHTINEETKIKISNSLKGVKKGEFSDEHKRKLSEAHKGKHPWNYGLKKNT